MQQTMAELEECLEEAVWGTQVVSRRWGIDVRDLLARTPEWCASACAPACCPACCLQTHS